jgi:hypothetical protein
MLIGISLFVFKPLLMLTAPLVGHATWKAYQNLLVEGASERASMRLITAS